MMTPMVSIIAEMRKSQIVIFGFLSKEPMMKQPKKIEKGSEPTRMLCCSGVIPRSTK